MKATKDTCGFCTSLKRTCTHNPSLTTSQCWGLLEGANLGMHSASCPAWCECDCHKGAYPQNSTITKNYTPVAPAPVSADDVREAIESIEDSVRARVTRDASGVTHVTRDE